jgi:L-threonylcarbamoyladenylate synthase
VLDPLIRAPSPAVLAAAAAAIAAGQLVVFPTETVYGLGCDAGNDRAVAAVFSAKGRPRINPLIVHVTGLDHAATIAEMSRLAQDLTARFWPGPLTLVLPRRPGAGLSLLVSAGLDTVAVRAPDHPVAQALLRAAGRPIAAPSANPSGTISPTCAQDVAGGSLRDAVALIVDGGRCRVGLESTVLDLSVDPPAVLRPGGVTADAIAAVIGPLATAGSAISGAARSPGLIGRHYAPNRPLRLNATAARPGELMLGFGAVSDPAGLNLSPAGDLTEAAANLFAMLRALDQRAPAVIAVASIPEHELGRAINDRLRRAALPPPDGPRSTPHDWDDERGPALPCVLPEDDAL